jgi:hypothetical protein
VEIVLGVPSWYTLSLTVPHIHLSKVWENLAVVLTLWKLSLCYFRLFVSSCY